MSYRYYLKLSDSTVCFIDSDLDMEAFKYYLKENDWLVVYDAKRSYFYGKSGKVCQKLHKRDVQVWGITSISHCLMEETDYYRLQDRYSVRYNLLKEIYNYKLNWWYKFLLHWYGVPKNLDNVDEVEWLWLDKLEKILKKVKKGSKGGITDE